MESGGPFSEGRPMPKQETHQLWTTVPLTNPEPALFPCGRGYNTVWLWSCHQYHLPKDPSEVMPPHATGNRLTDLTPGCGPEVAVTWLQLLLANRSICPGTRQETHSLCAPWQALQPLSGCRSWIGLYICSSPFRLENSLPTRGPPRDILV